MKIATTTVQQTANEVLGVAAKNLYYLVLVNEKGNKLVINVGEKTHKNVQAMIDDETTKPKGGK